MAHRSPVPTFPCPTCARIVRAGDVFCGFCGKPLRVQCPACGAWTKAHHMVCPACGARLHGPGLSFAQNQELKRLLSTLAEIERARAQSAQCLADARRTHRQTIVRLFLVGVFGGLGLLLVTRVMATLLSTLLGLLGVLLVLIVCRRLIPGVPGLLARVSRWIAPGDLAYWKQEQEAERARLAELNQARDDTLRAMAHLRKLAEPSLWDEEDEEEVLEEDEDEPEEDEALEEDEEDETDEEALEEDEAALEEDDEDKDETPEESENDEEDEDMEEAWSVPEPPST